MWRAASGGIIDREAFLVRKRGGPMRPTTTRRLVAQAATTKASFVPKTRLVRAPAVSAVFPSSGVSPSFRSRAG
jgi:hypothetical protein